MTQVQRRGGKHRKPRPVPPPSVSILDIAFHRASLATPRGDTKAARDRLRAELKIVRSSATVARHLRLETRRFLRSPPTPFESTLLAQTFGSGSLERSLTRVRRAEERIRGLAQAAERSSKGASGSEELGDQIRAFYGRLSSFVREVDPDILRLRAMAQHLDDRPHLDPATPTLVVAGFPNVGKSSLVARLSSAHPKVADYPFTTLSIAVGHADLGFDRLQVLDTPGVLGRSGQANPAESEAKSAVKGAATVVLFVIDPSGKSGYPIEEQERLLARWKEEFPQLPIIEVETKCDLVRRPTGRLQVSATTGEGLETLESRVRALVRPQGELPPIQESLTEETPSFSEFEEREEARTGGGRTRKGGRRSSHGP
ncbi:MAG TPA: GTPase [Thermoplasmata archaeon]|nr:GTPase [Thermoplasmata archaeon]